jgi:hypothetical protein
MADDPIPADAAHAMQTVTRYQAEIRAARGRFGRDVPGLAPDDVQMADARTTMHTDDAPERGEAIGYQVDPDAVAAAIIDRLKAGRTLPGRADDA